MLWRLGKRGMSGRGLLDWVRVGAAHWGRIHPLRGFCWIGRLA